MAHIASLVDSEVEVAKKSVKKAAVAGAKKSVKPATKTTSAKKPAPKPAVKVAAKGKAVASKSTKTVSSSPAAKNNVKKPVLNGKAATPSTKTDKREAAVAEKNGTHAKTSVAPAKTNVAPVKTTAAPAKTSVAANAKTLAKTPSPVVTTPEIKPEPPKPTGRPMLLQGPIAVKPMGKKATLPPPPPKPAEKPVKKKRLIPDGEPAFVVVQPPTKAVATSEKAAKNKAGLSQKDLDFFRDLLLAKRRELLGDMNHMEREALRENSSDLSNLPVHMADQGTDAYEQEFTLHLVEKDRTLLRELNDALAKIQNGTYGICEGTGLPISKARLEAQPWARYSIEHARVLEKRQMMFRR